MLAARDQENRVFGGSVAGGKQLNGLAPKTPAPGGKGALTPMMKGRSVLGGRPGNENALRTVGKGKNLVTPQQPRTAARAPLGNKTTNAKAMQSQMQQQQQKTTQKGVAVKDIVNQFEKSQPQQAPASGRRGRGGGGVMTPRTTTTATTSTKLSVLSDQPAAVPEVEYCPPPVAPEKYTSDVFPEGALTFAAFQPQNRLRGYYEHYFINKNNPVDETDGVPLRDKAMAERQRKAFEKLDLQVQKDLEEFDWAALSEATNNAKATVKATTKATTTDAKALKASQPPTIALRNAASALALGPKRTIRAPSASKNVNVRPKTPAAAPSAAAASSVSSSLLSGLPLRKAGRPTSALPMRPKPVTAAANAAAESASRTTLGYKKGRTALSMVRGGSNIAREGAETATVKLQPTASQPAAKRFVPSTEIASLGTSSIEVPSTPVNPSSGLRGQTGMGDLGSGLDGPAVERSPAFLSIFEVDENDMHQDDDEDEEDDDDDDGRNDEEVTLGMGGRSGTFGNLAFDLEDDDFQMDANFD